MGAVTHVEGQWERITDHIPIRARVVISNTPPRGSNGITKKETKK